MSYGFRVVSKDGALTVEKVTSEVPDGEWRVNGHEDDHGGTLSVSKGTDAQSSSVAASVSWAGKR